MPTAAGVNVSPASATRCTAVRAAVAALSEPCGHLPLDVYRRGANGAHEPELNHPVARLLSGAANPWTTAQQFREQLVRDALLHGDGFGYIVRDGNGTPRELHRLKPGSVSLSEDLTTAEPVYRVTAQNGAINGIVPRTNIIHLRGPLAADGIRGVSPVHEAREAIALALQLEGHASRLFGNPKQDARFAQQVASAVDAALQRPDGFRRTEGQKLAKLAGDLRGAGGRNS